MSSRVLVKCLWLGVVGFILTASHAVAQDEAVGPTLEQAGYSSSSDMFRAADKFRYERLDGLDRYKVTRRGEGFFEFLPPITEYYDVIHVRRPEQHESTPFARQVPGEELTRRAALEDTGMSPEQLANFYQNYATASIWVGAAAQAELSNRGVGPSMSQLSTMTQATNMEDDCDSDWASPDNASYKENQAGGVAHVPMSPFGSAYDGHAEGMLHATSPLMLMMGQACVLYGGAKIMRGEDTEAIPEVQERIRDIEEVAQEIEFVRVDLLPDGTEAFELHLPLNRSEVVDGQTVHLNSATTWIGTENLELRQIRMEGTREADGEVQPFFLERLLDDYRDVPGSQMYEPYRETLRTGGMFSDEQQAEMQQALVELEKLDEQMASMPAGQRAMMEKMMAPQIENMRSLANGGAVEFVIVTTNIEINPTSYSSRSRFSEADQNDNLLQRIQLDLTTLGYEPGNVDGELSKPTVVAIVQFETDNGMAVTGEATSQLAAALSDAVRRND